MSEQLLVMLTKQNSSREMYSPIRRRIKNNEKHMGREHLCFWSFFMCRCIAEYISLELFYSVNIKNKQKNKQQQKTPNNNNKEWIQTAAFSDSYNLFLDSRLKNTECTTTQTSAERFLPSEVFRWIFSFFNPLHNSSVQFKMVSMQCC